MVVETEKIEALFKEVIKESGIAGRMTEMDRRIKIFSGQTILLSQRLEELMKKAING